MILIQFQIVNWLSKFKPEVWIGYVHLSCTAEENLTLPQISHILTTLYQQINNQPTAPTHFFHAFQYIQVVIFADVHTRISW